MRKLPKNRTKLFQRIFTLERSSQLFFVIFWFFVGNCRPYRSVLYRVKGKKKKSDRVSLCPFHFQVLLEPGQRKKLVPIFLSYDHLWLHCEQFFVKLGCSFWLKYSKTRAPSTKCLSRTLFALGSVEYFVKYLFFLKHVMRCNKMYLIKNIRWIQLLARQKILCYRAFSQT